MNHYSRRRVPLVAPRRRLGRTGYESLVPVLNADRMLKPQSEAAQRADEPVQTQGYVGGLRRAPFRLAPSEADRGANRPLEER